MYDYLAIILTIHEMVCIGISFFFVILFLYTIYYRCTYICISAVRSYVMYVDRRSKFIEYEI